MVGSEGIALFENGQLTEQAQVAVQFCSDFETERRRTDQLLEQLKRLDLFEPKVATFTPRGTDGALGQPLQIADRATQFDVVATVEGSGLSGQAGAVRHAISKALTYYEPGLRPVLKPHGFLTRDPRVVERKKYGKAKARRSFQFSKR